MRVSLAGMLAVAIALVAGGTGEAAPAVNACALLTKSELRPFLKDRAIDQSPGEQYGTGSGTTCSYPGAAIQIDTYPFSVYESTWSRDKGNLEQISGLGDAAYLYRNARAFGAEIAVRVGQRVLAAQVDLDQGESMDSARTRVIGLARAVVAKLR